MKNEIKFEQPDSKGTLSTLGQFDVSELLALIRKYDFDESAKTLFIAYLDYTVIIGKLKNKDLLYFDPNENKEHPLSEQELKFLQKLRVFNPDEELYIWKSDSGKTIFSARYRNDKKGSEPIEPIEYMEANHILFGTRNETIENFSYSSIQEDRGTEIILPFTDIDINENKRLAIKTRYYIKYNDLGIAQYMDLRFVEFVIIDKNEEIYLAEV